MKILGISGSTRKEGTSGGMKLVQTVLENTGIEYELVSLRNKSIPGCIAFLERWFQFRYQTGRTLWGKLAVAVGAAVTQRVQDKMMSQFGETA